jgi:prepilin-type N-terminal cleavage/methylation domain-containing protein
MNDELMNFGIRNAECGIKMPSSLFDMPKNPKSAIRNLQSGITLIEVILVMVIIGILAAIVIPKTDVTLTSGTSVNGAANMIASDIRYAQEWAMANRTSKTVTFSSTIHPTYYTFGPTSGLDPSGQLPSGVTIISDFTITFNSLGEPTTGGGGSVTVRVGAAGGLTRTITVLNYTGKVNIT